MARTERFNVFAKGGPKAFKPPAPLLDSAGKPIAGDQDSDWKIGIRNESGRLEILMHDTIGDPWVGLDSATIAQAVRDNRGKEIHLDINSFGGSAYDGIAIYNALLQHDAYVQATVTGIAYSAASIIPMAADRIIMAEISTMGIHPSWLATWGNQFALRDSAKWLEGLDEDLIDTYAARSGQPREMVQQWFLGDNHDGTFFRGKQAVELGFADELMPLKKKEKSGSEDSITSAPPAAMAERLVVLRNREAAAARQQRIHALAQRMKEFKG